jgi:soluble lytic murein transglycosylase-like protein
MAIIVALLLLAGLALVLLSNIRPAVQGSSFGSNVGELDTAEVPNGWAQLIEEAAEEADVPAPVLAAPIEVESDWQTDAVSPAGAQGLSQFMPET